MDAVHCHSGEFALPDQRAGTTGTSERRSPSANVCQNLFGLCGINLRAQAVLID
jgi:hypothetical protein